MALGKGRQKIRTEIISVNLLGPEGFPAVPPRKRSCSVHLWVKLTARKDLEYFILEKCFLSLLVCACENEVVI